MTHLAYSATALEKVASLTNIQKNDDTVIKASKFAGGLPLKVSVVAFAAFEFVLRSVFLTAASPLYFLSNKTFTDMTATTKSAAKTILDATAALATIHAVEKKADVAAVAKTFGDHLNVAAAYLKGKGNAAWTTVHNNPKTTLAVVAGLVGVVALYYNYSTILSYFDQTKDSQNSITIQEAIENNFKEKHCLIGESPVEKVIRDTAPTSPLDSTVKGAFSQGTCPKTAFDFSPSTSSLNSNQIVHISDDSEANFTGTNFQETGTHSSENSILRYAPYAVDLIKANGKFSADLFLGLIGSETPNWIEAISLPIGMFASAIEATTALLLAKQCFSSCIKKGSSGKSTDTSQSLNPNQQSPSLIPKPSQPLQQQDGNTGESSQSPSSPPSSPVPGRGTSTTNTGGSSPSPKPSQPLQQLGGGTGGSSPSLNPNPSPSLNPNPSPSLKKTLPPTLPPKGNPKGGSINAPLGRETQKKQATTPKGRTGKFSQKDEEWIASQRPFSKRNRWAGFYVIAEAFNNWSGRDYQGKLDSTEIETILTAYKRV